MRYLSITNIPTYPVISFSEACKLRKLQSKGELLNKALISKELVGDNIAIILDETNLEHFMRGCFDLLKSYTYYSFEKIEDMYAKIISYMCDYQKPVVIYDEESELAYLVKDETQLKNLIAVKQQNNKEEVK